MRSATETMALLDATTIRSLAAQAFAAEPDSVACIRHAATAVYRCRTAASDEVVLRFSSERIVSRRAAEANARFLEHAEAEGASVSAVVRTRGGDAVVPFDLAGEPFLLTAVRAVPGRTLSRDDAEPRIFHAWGEAMARLHLAAECYAPEDPGAYLDEAEHWRATRDSLPDGDELAHREWQRLDAWWRDLPPGDRGLTHADMNAGNAIWDGTLVTLIDFDEPIWHAFASDLARPFREMGHLDASVVAEAKRALLAGYRTQRPLDPAWDETLPGFVRMKQLEMYAWMLATGDDPDERDPSGERRADFLAARRAEFARHARSG